MFLQNIITPDLISIDPMSYIASNNAGKKYNNYSSKLLHIPIQTL